MVWMIAAYTILRNYTLIYEAFGFNDEQPVVVGIAIVTKFVLAP